MIRLQHPDALLQTEAAAIAAGHLQRRGGHIDGIHPGFGKGHGARQRDGARAGPDIENAAHAARVHPRPETLQNEFGNGRARHQHPLVHIQLEAGKK